MNIVIVSHFHYIYTQIAKHTPKFASIFVTGPGRTVDELIGFIASLKPEIIIIDIRLNFQAGLEVIRKIRTFTYPITIITTVVASSEKYRIRCMEAGANNHFRLPEEYYELGNLISRLCNAHQPGDKNVIGKNREYA